MTETTRLDTPPTEFGMRAYSVGMGLPYLGNLYVEGRVQRTDLHANCPHPATADCLCGIHYVQNVDAFVEEILSLWTEYKYRVREPLLTVAGALSIGTAHGWCCDDPAGDTDPWGGEKPRRAAAYRMRKLYVSTRCAETKPLLERTFGDIPVQLVDPDEGPTRLRDTLDNELAHLRRTLTVA
ncbi:hypothetical protein ABZU78_29305 [Rhodococcus erythropolis]|uniref:hypothetical protein n=1 Tax=Rhodococcus erythropolis TaxID=1833 RepID=UPI0033B4F0DC